MHRGERPILISRSDVESGALFRAEAARLRSLGHRGSPRRVRTFAIVVGWIGVLHFRLDHDVTVRIAMVAIGMTVVVRCRCESILRVLVDAMDPPAWVTSDAHSIQGALPSKRTGFPSPTHNQRVPQATSR